MSVFVIAEHDNQQLNPSTPHVLSAARLLNLPITVLVAGYGCKAVAEAVASCEGVHTVMLADSPVYEHQLPSNLAQLIVSVAKDHVYFMGPATTFGKQLLPCVAALLDTEQVSDVIAIESADTFVRPIYAGNALQRIKHEGQQKVLTIRPTAFPAVDTASVSADIKHLDSFFPLTGIRFQSLSRTVTTRPALQDARIIISGGRALKSAENFKWLEAIADKLGAAVGASRAAVDAGFVPNEYQIGQTGKIVAPDLYIAVGISGAIQHIAGMKDSKVIVAINKDPDAPIFQIADYGVVGDLFTLLSELEAELTTDP